MFCFLGMTPTGWHCSCSSQESWALSSVVELSASCSPCLSESRSLLVPKSHRNNLPDAAVFFKYPSIQLQSCHSFHSLKISHMPPELWRIMPEGCALAVSVISSGRQAFSKHILSVRQYAWLCKHVLLHKEFVRKTSV